MSHVEATSLKTMLEPQVDKKKEVDEMKNIMDQIALAKFASMKRSMTQGKNILRVMIGEKPQVPRSNNDTNESKPERMFPVERTVPPPSIKPKAPAKKKVKKLDPPLGERAIRRSMKKAYDHNNGVAFGFIKGKEELGLQLTMIETYILMTFSCEGMPLVADFENKQSELSASKSWEDISNTLCLIAREQMKETMDLLMLAKACLAKGQSQNFEEKQIKALAVNVSRAESGYAIAEEAARLANDFSQEPDQRLSKKRYVV